MFGYEALIYRVSVLQDLLPYVIPSQKCYTNMGPILNVYRVVDICFSHTNLMFKYLSDVISHIIIYITVNVNDHL